MTKRPNSSSSLARSLGVTADWEKLFKLIPDYDPIKTARDCRFDPAKAEHAVNFFATILKHNEGKTAGKPFILEPWQKAIIGCLFGWRRPDGTRRYREGLIYEPRKNGKTPKVAGIALYCFLFENEAGSEIYCASSDKETAARIYKHATGFIGKCRELGRRLKINRSYRTITKRDDAEAFIKVLTKGGDTKHGGNPHVVLIDELHVTEAGLVDVLNTSMASATRANPLTLYITTADYVRESICNTKLAYAKKVCSGAIDDEAFLPVIYETPHDADWQDEKVWERVNPNIDISVSRQYLRSACKKALVMPSFEATFRRMHLNQQTKVENVFIPLLVWDKIDGEVDAREWRERKIEQRIGDSCVGALDLGSVADLTGLVLLFDDGAGGVDCLPWFWVPRDTADLRTRTDEAPYGTWIEHGFIIGTDGERTDYDQVRADINKLGGDFGITSLGVDQKFQGQQLMTQLEQDGFETYAASMSPKDLVSPSKTMIELSAAGKFHHGNNPVMRWMLSNTAGKEWMEHVFPVKSRRGVRIDGIICSVLALSKWMLSDGGADDYYDEHDLFVVGGDGGEEDDLWSVDE